MNIEYSRNKEKSYKLNIDYLYFGLAGTATKRFGTLTEFEGFMNECHPGISISKAVDKYNVLLSKLTEKANEVNFDIWNEYTYLYCAICGEELFSSIYDCAVIEKMLEYKEAKDRANEGYIQSVVANTWGFNKEDGIMRVKYWFDPDDVEAPKYKIHAFKDKVILETSSGKPSSIINTSDYYIHCEGKKKISG